MMLKGVIGLGTKFMCSLTDTTTITYDSKCSTALLTRSVCARAHMFHANLGHFSFNSK